MKNSTKVNKNNLPSVKKKTINKKSKDKQKNKNVKDLIKNDLVHLIEQNDKFNDKLIDKSSDKSTDKSSDKSTDKSTDKSSDKNLNKSKKNETKTSKQKKNKKELSNDNTNKKSTDKLNDKSTDKSNDKTSEKLNDKSNDKANKPEKSDKNKKSKSIDKPNKTNSKIKNKPKDEVKKSSSKTKSKSTKNSNASKIKNEDKKLAALLQLQEMRPRGPRLASLNASCKMQLLYESEREKLNDQIANNSEETNDTSTEEIDTIESVINETSKLNSINPEDLLTEDEQEDDVQSEDDHEEAEEEIVETKSNNKKKTTEKKIQEEDLLSESINSVINSINEDLNNKKKKEKQSTDKKKKVEKEAKDKSISKSKSTKQQSKDNQKSIDSSKTKDKQQSRQQNKDKKDAKKPESTKKKANKNKKALVKENDKKRKLIDESVELIDTRSTKRLASLNCSAIMAASYQDEKPLLPIQQSNSKQSTPQPQSPKSDYDEKHVEVIHKTTTVKDDEVTETIQHFKKVHHVSGKIRDRLLAIEMMETEHTENEHTEEEEDNEDELVSGIIEEPETDDEEQNAQKTLGKSVLQKKINASSKQQQNNLHNAGSSEIIEELNNDDIRHRNNSSSTKYNSNNPKSSYVTSTNNNGDTTVTSVTKTTKYKINKKKNNDGYNSLAIENLKTSSANSSTFDKAPTISPEQHQATLNGNNNLNGHQAAASATQFVPYGMQSTPYCVYPNATALQLAYQQHLAQQQQLAYQQLQQASLLQQFSTMPIHQPTENISQPQSSTLNMSSLNNLSTNDSSNNVSSTKQSYKSAFNAKPHNSSASLRTNSTTSKSTASSTSNSTKSNGVGQQNNSLGHSINDNSYLIHKPLAFKAATGSPIFNSTNNAATSIQLNQLAHLKTEQPSHHLNTTIIHPAAQQASNLLSHAAQTSSLVPAMQYFSNPALTGSPYIFQYPQAPDLATQLNPLTAFHSQPQLPNSTLISPASQYSTSAFATTPNLNQFNIALIPGQNTFLNAANQQLAAAAAQTPMFINPILNSLNPISAVPNFGIVEPLSLGIQVGSTVEILKDSSKSSKDVIIVKTLNDLKPSKEKTKKVSSSKEVKQFANGVKKSFKNQTIANEKKTEVPITINLNCNQTVDQKSLNSNTITTTSTKTKPAVIKIKPSFPSSTETNNSQNIKIIKTIPSNKASKPKNSTKIHQNGDISIKNASLATGIRKDREKKLTISTNQMNKVIKTNNLNMTKTANEINKITINSDHQLNKNQNSINTIMQQNNIKQSPKTNSISSNSIKEPVVLKSTNNVTDNKINKTTNLLLLGKSPQQQTKKDSFTIILNNNKKESNGSKLLNKNQDNLPLITGKKLRIDLNTSDSISKSNQPSNDWKNSITITPILNTPSNSNLTSSTKVSSNKDSSSSLTAVQLDTASMRSNASITKKSSTNNMLNQNQTGKSLTIHPSNFYSNSAINFNSTATLNKKQTDFQAYQSTTVGSLKVNDANLENLNESSMKGLNKKASKSNQVKHSEVIDQEKLLLSHGWRWVGEPVKKQMVMISDNNNQLRETYSQMKHVEGEVISTGDCALLRSGPKKNDVPFVAKITSLFEYPQTKAMMMNLYWYYRPEHTDLVISKSDNWSSDAEIFASKHRDVNSVACIDDRCFVLTLNEFCRYKKRQKMLSMNLGMSLTEKIVPKSKEPYHRANRLPPDTAQDSSVFCCRKVYDSRNKRILKNPS